jgi:hypothetical protein
MACNNLTILDQIAKFFLLLSDAPLYWFTLNTRCDHAFHLSNGNDGRHDDCNGCQRRDNNQLASAAMDRDSAMATQQQQHRRQWSARWSNGNGQRCGNGHEKYNNQLAKAAMDGATAAMDGATAMDGNGRRNRATAMAAMEDGHWRGDGNENDNNQ